MAKDNKPVTLSLDDFEAAQQDIGISQKDLESIASQTGASPEATRSVLTSALGLLAGSGNNSSSGSLLSALAGGGNNNANSGNLLLSLLGAGGQQSVAQSSGVSQNQSNSMLLKR